MPQQLAMRPKIGDLIEIATPKGFAYAQYTHEHSRPPRMGSLLRVLPGVFSSRPESPERLIDGRELFSTFYPLRVELGRHDTQFKIIGNERIPEWAIAFPVFRNGLPSPDGIVHEWWLWDGEKEWRHGKITPEIVSFPVLGIVNDTLLFEMIEKQYTPEGDI